jgi:tRNA (guanine-N7-)-methyltransferase
MADAPGAAVADPSASGFSTSSKRLRAEPGGPSYISRSKRVERVFAGKARAAEGEHLPQKKFFRQRAHINPLASAQVYTYPVDPQRMEWGLHYPAHAAPSSGGGDGGDDNAGFGTGDVRSLPLLSSVSSSLAPLAQGRYVEVADVGCGFGGLIVGLSPALPGSLMVGMEIRPKVTEYVRLRILALRRLAARAASAAAAAEDASPAGAGAGADAAAAANAARGGADSADDAEDDADEAEAAAAADVGASGVPDAAAAAVPGCPYDNISVLKTNAMKYLPNFFVKGQLKKIFFCFPDPQFKPSHHRRRIVNTQLLAEYAYALDASEPGSGGSGRGLAGGARLYTITDVEDLHNWMTAHAEAHPCFARISDDELADDPCVAVMREATEEGKKVARLGGSKWVAVFRRLTDAEAEAKAAAFDFWQEPPVHYQYLPAPSQKSYAEQTAANIQARAAKAAGKAAGADGTAAAAGGAGPSSGGV